MSVILASLHRRPVPPLRPAVLVLDASAALGLSVIRSLRKYGVDAVLATSGAQALRTCKTQDVRAVIFNDAARGARHHLADLERSHPELPMVVIGSDNGTTVEASSKTGQTAHFSKPLDINAVVEQLTEWVGPAISEFGGGGRTRWSGPAVGASIVDAPVTGRDRKTRQFASGESNPVLGTAPTRQVASVAGHPSAAQLGRESRHVTGSYSIVHRRQATVQLGSL